MEMFFPNLLDEFEFIIILFNRFFLHFERGFLNNFITTPFFIFLGLGSITALLGLIGSGLSSASKTIKRSGKK